MKIKKHYIVSLLLLQVFLLTSANAFAFSGPSLDLDSGPGEYLRTNQNKKAVLFEDFVSEVDFRLTSEDENELQFTLSNISFLTETWEARAKAKLFSEFQLNGKKLLKTQIFPFHFFW